MPVPAYIVERLKRTVLVWLAVYPTVLLVLGVAGGHFRHWPLPLRVLASTAIIVPLVVNISSPLVQSVMTLLGKASRRIGRRDDTQ